jgi:hypothetical protein
MHPAIRDSLHLTLFKLFPGHAVRQVARPQKLVAGHSVSGHEGRISPPIRTLLILKAEQVGLRSRDSDCIAASMSFAATSKHIKHIDSYISLSGTPCFFD